MALHTDHRAGTPDPRAHRRRRRGGGGRERGTRRQSRRGRRTRAASRSQLYHYFDDKTDLLRAVAEATNDAVLDGQRALFAELDSWDGLSSAGPTLSSSSKQQHGGRGGCPIANLVAQLGERDDDIRIVLASGFDRWEATSVPASPTMVDTGELRADTDIDWLAASTLASLQGGLILTQARRDPQALRRALDGALALIAAYRTSAQPGRRS